MGVPHKRIVADDGNDDGESICDDDDGKHKTRKREMQMHKPKSYANKQTSKYKDETRRINQPKQKSRNEKQQTQTRNKTMHLRRR